MNLSVNGGLIRAEVPIRIIDRATKYNTMEALHQLFLEKMKLSNEYYEQFMNLSKTIYLQKREFLIKENTICAFMGFVESGVLRSILMKEGESLPVISSLQAHL